MPVSLVGTFILFPMLGFSINTLSLFGLVLAIGLVVDDAIVVVEAVEHHIEHGLSPKEATLKAMEEVSGPVIAIALILSAVFIPTAFIPGITGQDVSAVRRHHRGIGHHLRFQRAHSEPGAVRHCCSSRASRAAVRWRHSSGGSIRCLVGPRTATSAVCDHGIRKAGLSFGILLALSLAAGLFGGKIPTSFLPDEDQGFVYAGIQLPDASSLQRTSEAAKEAERYHAQDSRCLPGKHRSGIQHVERRQQHVQCILLCDFQAMVGAKEQRKRVTT